MKKKIMMISIILFAMVLITSGVFILWNQDDQEKPVSSSYGIDEILQIVKQDYGNSQAIYEVQNETEDQVEVSVKLSKEDKEYVVYSVDRKTGNFAKGIITSMTAGK